MRRIRKAVIRGARKEKSVHIEEERLNKRDPETFIRIHFKCDNYFKRKIKKRLALYLLQSLF